MIVYSPPFVVVNELDGPTTNIMVLVNNQDKPARKVQIEVDFNKGRQTQFMELYQLYVPANQVVRYGYKYRVNFEYDTIRVLYGTK